MKLVSVIIPVYNAAKYIKKTVESCIIQSYSAIEIIIVDDCSTDESVNIIRNLSLKYTNITLIENKENQGVIKTVNKGIKLSKGDYIVVLGNDDILESNHIEVMRGILEKEKCSFVYCSSVYIDENDCIIGESKTADINQERLAFAKKNIVNSCGLMMQKDAFEEVGGYPESLGYRNYGEWYLWIKLIEVAPAVYTTAVKTKYRIHSNNLTKSFLKRENMQSTKKYNIECMKLAAKQMRFTRLQKICLCIYRFVYNMKMFFHMYIKRG